MWRRENSENVTSLLLHACVVPWYIKYTYVYIHVFYKYKNSAYFLQGVSINSDDDDDDDDDDACVLFLST